MKKNDLKEFKKKLSRNELKGIKGSIRAEEPEEGLSCGCVSAKCYIMTGSEATDCRSGSCCS
jgi:hypothetical protein